MAIPGHLPYFFSGKVVHGFGRGGKLLGCPTANVDDSAVLVLPCTITQGVYWGLARVSEGQVLGMVMSIGTNPHFNNERKTMEVHLLHDFKADFYDQKIDGLIIGFVREMKSFASLEDLTAAIEEDKRMAKENLTTINKEDLEEKYFKGKR